MVVGMVARQTALNMWHLPCTTGLTYIMANKDPATPGLMIRSGLHLYSSGTPFSCPKCCLVECQSVDVAALNRCWGTPASTVQPFHQLMMRQTHVQAARQDALAKPLKYPCSGLRNALILFNLHILAGNKHHYSIANITSCAPNYHAYSPHAATVLFAPITPCTC